MYCPLCGSPLRATLREGVEIDHCPTCNGLWLDPGELDQLLRVEAQRALQIGQAMLTAQRQGKEFDALHLAIPDLTEPQKGLT